MTTVLVAVKDGIIKALKTGLMLLKIMVPIYLLVVIIKYSPIMPWLGKIFAPAMKLFNLPSEASVPLITGLVTDEYGVVAAMSGFDFSTATITTIAMISLMAHSLPVESALAQKMGFPAGKVAIFRLGMAVITGVLVGWIGGVFS